MRTNVAVQKHNARTYEGAPAIQLTGEQALTRAVLSCFLWEATYYEKGVTVAKRIEDLTKCRQDGLPLTSALESVDTCDPGFVAELARKARNQYGLRHVSLYLIACLAWNRTLRAEWVEPVIQRADEPGELLALYWSKGKRPIPYAIRNGIGAALREFDEYQITKYATRKAGITVRDVLRLCHPVPKDAEQSALWKTIVSGDVRAPDTWESRLSSGQDKRKAFSELLESGKMGYLALLRNLRNMGDAGVDAGLIERALLELKGARRVLPFRFIAAAKHAPRYAMLINQALLKKMERYETLPGETFILVDVSGSMKHPVSEKSELTRMDAAAGLASIWPGRARVFSFSYDLREVPNYKGLPGIHAIVNSQTHGGTYLGGAIEELRKYPHDRLIVLTDEQSHDTVRGPTCSKSYMINIATTDRSVATHPWVRVAGFSEAILDWISAYESIGGES